MYHSQISRWHMFQPSDTILNSLGNRPYIYSMTISVTKGLDCPEQCAPRDDLIFEFYSYKSDSSYRYFKTSRCIQTGKLYLKVIFPLGSKYYLTVNRHGQKDSCMWGNTTLRNVSSCSLKTTDLINEVLLPRQSNTNQQQRI